MENVVVVVDEIDNTETLLFNESQLTNNSTRNYDVRFEDSDESSSHSSVDDASDHENNILVMDEYLPLEDGEDFGEFVSNTNQLAGEEEKIGYSIDDEINEITNISQGNSNASSRFTVDCTGSNSTIGIQPLSKDRIALIKSTISKITISPRPTLDNLVAKLNYRVGDEIAD